MAKQKTVVPFHGTAEQERQLRQIIADHKDTEGALMPVLQKAQEVYGYLPIEVQTIIAEGLGLARSAVVIKSGHTARQKLLRIAGAPPDLLHRFDKWLNPAPSKS